MTPSFPAESNPPTDTIETPSHILDALSYIYPAGIRDEHRYHVENDVAQNWLSRAHHHQVTCKNPAPITFQRTGKGHMALRCKPLPSLVQRDGHWENYDYARHGGFQHVYEDTRYCW